MLVKRKKTSKQKATGYRLTLADLLHSHPDPGMTTQFTRLTDLVRSLSTRYKLRDYSPLLIPGIIYLANKRLNAPPVWMLISGPSSLGKTTAIEFIKTLDHVIELGDITKAGLLSGAKKESEESTGGVLEQAGQWAVLTLKDMTTILSGDQKETARLMAALREIYDQHWQRHVGTDGGRSLNYTGKCGLIGGLTPAASGLMHTKGAEMGERCLIISIGSVANTIMSTDIGQQALRNIPGLVRESPNSKHTIISKEELTNQYLEWLGLYNEQDATVSLAESRVLAKYADIIASCRVLIPRNYAAEINSQHYIEATARASSELGQVFATARGLGYPTALVWDLVRNIVSSTMPVERHNTTRIMTILLKDTATTTIPDIMAYPKNNPESGLNVYGSEKILQQSLEDLTIVGLVKKHKNKVGPNSWGWNDQTLIGSYFAELM